MWFSCSGSTGLTGCASYLQFMVVVAVLPTPWTLTGRETLIKTPGPQIPQCLSALSVGAMAQIRTPKSVPRNLGSVVCKVCGVRGLLFRRQLCGGGERAMRELSRPVARYRGRCKSSVSCALFFLLMPRGLVTLVVSYS
ncbi:hypothetical protein B0T21DRAFT_28407 [Apiosordaria backusii]|uniref:Uncharacterized protein n=1 Tax=Apiosordaria backusii TaxID=314023 RepID=A0AA40K7H8_9PEZI|nr:hypothetical protein B0T21DRAFT_28407 [Apiosordaria backusii]